MRGKRYDAGKRRVFSGGGYIGVIIAVVILAALVATTLLVLLPTAEESPTDAPTIVGITYPEGEIGAGRDLSKVYFTVTYSNGDVEQVALGSMMHEGLDITLDKEQTISVSYGGFEDTISVRVKRVDCVLSYSASAGGRIQGDGEQTVLSGGDADTVIAVPETGYEFVGWSDGYPYAERKDTGVNESKAYIANFEKSKFSVVFFFRDGSTVQEEKVVYGEKAINIPDHNDPRMKVYGYTFVGWSVSEEDYSNVTRDMNIYPRYEKTATDVVVEVSTDSAGNEMGSTDANECGYYAHSDTEKAVITASPSNSREFNEWTVLNSDGEYVSLGKDSQQETEVEIGDKRTKVSFRVSAASEPGKYTISFYCSADVDYIYIKAEFAYASSSVSFVNYQNQAVGNIECRVDDVANLQTIGEKIAQAGVTRPDGKLAVIDDDENSPNRGLPLPDDVAGMTFVGWYMQNDPEQRIISAQQTFTEPTTLMAKWEKKLYTITFEYYDENGVKQTYGDDIYVYYQNTVGSGGGIPAGVPIRDRYVFNGWLDAKTSTTVDDSTQIIMRDEYGTGQDTDFAKGIIRMIAQWAPVEHELRIDAGGEGTVRLTQTDETGNEESRDVPGQTAIYENNRYRVTFDANDGYKVAKVIWQYGNETQIYSGAETQAATFHIDLAERYDNYISVEFEPIRYRITVENGDGTNGGYVVTENGSVYDANSFNLTVNANAAIRFTVLSGNEIYAIERIIVTGKADGRIYEGEAKYDYEGVESVTESEVVLEKVLSDITVSVRYKGRYNSVSVNQQPFAGGGYPIMQTTFNGRESDYTVPATQSDYAYGTRVFYAIKTNDGEYLSEVLINGVSHGLYEFTGGVYFYDWEINGKSLGISLLLIDGKYYYCYGKAGAETFGTDYVYCENAETWDVAIFETTGGEYVRIDETTVGGAAVKAYLEETLKVNEKRLSDYGVTKDSRVTAVKMMIVLTANVNLSVRFENISYAFDVEETDYATVEYTAENVAAGGSVTVSASPITGYKITGYEINGVRTNVSSDGSGACVFTVSGITEDKKVKIICEAIKYNILFVNSTPLAGQVFVREISVAGDEKNLLDSTFVYALEYASGGRFEITVSEGKRIVSVKIDGKEREIVYNAAEFVYANYHVSKDVRIEISCADKESDETTGSAYNVAFNIGENVSRSVQYAVGGKNVITLVAEYGYKLKTATVNGMKDGTGKAISVDFAGSIPDFAEYYEELNKAVIYLDVDAFDGTATVICSYEPERFTLTTNAATAFGGAVLGGGTIYYGDTASVTVSADENYYVSSFKVNGEEISFAGSGWTSKTASAYAGKYTAGEYTFIAGGDVEIEVEFSLFTYKVTLDASSINGTTEFFIDGTSGENDGSGRIAHGSDLGISMKADAGYHISKIYVNGVDIGYIPYTTVANDNTDHSYVYANVTEDVKVYVVYEINRYEFRFNLVNGSANFAGESDSGNRLECADATLTGDNVYGNIAYGDNFSITVTPGASKGYYVHSVRIVYSRYEGGERIRYAGDGFTSDGGTIWFNRFLWDNNAAGSVGVTANIELIEVVFKRRTYEVTIEQIGEEIAGTAAFSVTNTTSAGSGVILFDGNDADSVRYLYSDGKIYREQNEGYAETDIKLTFIDGEWKFFSETERATYSFYFEYGLRYTVALVPTTGYERSAFTVNGDDRSGSVYNDRYSFNVYRTTALRVEFSILRFDVSMKVVAYQSNMAEVSERNTYQYASVKLIKVNDDGTEEVIAEIEEGKSSINVTLDYGTKIKFEFTPNFAEHGAYLFNLQSGNVQLSFTGDPTGTVVYGGEGIETVNDMAFRATFRIMEYQIRVNTEYEEDIRGETLNVFASDSTSVISWKASWNSSTVIKTVAGTGYYVDRIVIVYDENGTEKRITISGYNEREDDFGGVEDGYAVSKNNDDAIYGLRDTLTLYGIKSDYTVTAYFAREAYEIIYVINELDYVESVKTSLNDRNAVYPDYYYNTKDGNGWTINSHYYDEITATIAPKDGYKISADEITVECVIIDENTGEFIILKDENGKEMVYTVRLTATGNGDERIFTFHPSNLPAAEHYIQSTVRIALDFEIKEYRADTTVNRTRAAGDTSAAGNNTEVRVGIRDKNNDQIVVNGVLQSDARFVQGAIPEVMTAQHHGFMLYTFTTPEGYMLTKFTINGFTLEEMTDNGIAEEYAVVKNSNGSAITYSYTVKVRVNSLLIAGSTKNPWVKINDLTVSMDFAPITYEVRIVINGEVMDYRTVNGRNGVTDGEQLTVYGAPTVTHFGISSIEPSLFEGYKISDTTTEAYFGTESGFIAEMGSRAGFMRVGTVISDFFMLDFKGSNLANSDVSEGKTYVYFLFNTEIITYTQEIGAKVFYSENSQLKEVPLSENTAGGSVRVTVTTRTGEEYVTDLAGITAFSESLEYFSSIRIVAEAKPGFSIYGIYEIFAVGDGTEDRRISSGTRNISYSVTGGIHVVVINVRDLAGEILGDRSFRIDFKQQATVTLTVANPYKYIQSTRRYASYAVVSAYSAEGELDVGVPSSSYAISNTNVVAGEIVVETYKYTVYVGNYLKFIISDRYQSSNPIVRFFDTDLSINALEAFTDEGISGLGESGTGERIVNAATDYYAYINVSGRITTSKTTVGAITTTNGGSVSYNSFSAGTGTSNSISDANTVPGKRLTIKIVPANNYAFYSLKIRQPNLTLSRRQGYVVFQTADALKWNVITKDEIGQEESLEGFAGSNYLRLVSTSVRDVTDSKGVTTKEYSFELWVCGDAEFEVEFYRTYTVSYGIYLTDKFEQGGAEEGILDTGVTFTPGSVTDTLFGEDGIGEGSTTGIVSYGASFELTASKPTGDYQFVGWYVNGYNLFTYLESLLPTDDYLTQRVTVNRDEMQSLIANGEEATSLTVYAVFQPIIDVLVYNEKYYAYDDHFNSWNLATVLATYYDFVRGKPVPASESTSSVRDMTGKTIEEARAYLEESNAYGSYGGAWSTLLKGTDATANYTGDLLNSKVYTSYEEFTLLYQNITDGNFYTDSWADTSVVLNVTSMSATAAFGSWQYFNWNTSTWNNIPYTYEDRSLGMSSNGKFTTVDCFFKSYQLNLSALYGLNGSNVLMPYAINANNPNNTVRDVDDLSGVRPLLIRADVYQTVTVNLTQNLYASDLSNEDPEQTLMPEGYVRSRILTEGNNLVETSPGAGRSSTDDTGRSGTYEYGTKITIMNNSTNPGGEIIYGNARYRFLGWFLKYNKNLYYMENSEMDASGKTTYSVMLTCLSDKPETQFMFIAIYVAQYKQTVYSYNVSGGSATSYQSASTSKNSVESAPVVSFVAPSSQVIKFNSFSLNSTDKITYESFVSDKYYWINNASGKDRLTVNGNDYAAKGREFEYYVDAGLTYEIKLPEVDSTDNTVTLDRVKSNSVTGYCPEIDTPYMFVKNRDEKNLLADFRSYYNTGNATYYDVDADRAVTANELHRMAYNKVGTIANDKEDAKKSNQYDITYVSTATLIFYNLTYRGGVSVPSSLASVISGDKTGELTVWDENTSYGDYNEISGGKPVGLGANGEVVIRVTLVCVTDKGYQGQYKFAFAGMDNGNGFPTTGEIVGPSGTGLFAPINDGTVGGEYVFTRWYEVDLSKRATTFLFGKQDGTGNVNTAKIGMHSATPAKYTVENCGTAVDGYNIMNVEQLKLIESFWKNNEESCVGIIRPSAFEMFAKDGTKNPIWVNKDAAEYTENYLNNYGRTTFKLCASSYNIVGLTITNKSNDPMGNRMEWEPLCKPTLLISEDSRYVWGTNKMPQRTGGFDGILEGNDAVISGIATKASAHTYFGLFSVISGGVARNLTIDNAYISSDNVIHVGLLAGMITYSTVSQITFDKKTNLAIYGPCGFASTITAGSRLYMNAQGSENAGALAGIINNSNVSGVSIYMGMENSSIEIKTRGNGGVLAGTIEGSDCDVSGITLIGATNAWIINGAYEGQPENAGGLVGLISSGARVSNVKIPSTVNMMIGNQFNTTSAGGVVGRINDNNSKLENVTFEGYKGSGADNFVYDIDLSTITGKGIFLLAKSNSAYGASVFGASVGRTGGFVGTNEGVINNLVDNRYSTVSGVLKMYSAYMGGIVGVNTGRVTGFDISTGMSGGAYYGMTILAWVPGELNSYGVGGIAGANLSTARATEKATTGINGDLIDFTVNKTLSGVVDDCSITGIGTPKDAGNATWNVGHIYAFLRRGSTDTSYMSIATGQAGSSLPFNYKHSLMMGGIVGYNRGSVFNSFVKSTKLTFNIQHNASNNYSNIEQFKDQYSWGLEAGLIVGYHDPGGKASDGWTNSGIMIINGYPDSMEDTTKEMLARDMISYRIQSCYSVNSVIAAVGRVYMDNQDLWTSGGYGNESRKCVISMAGIAGGSSANGDSEFSINTCFATGNVFIYDATAAGNSGRSGSDRSNDGWYNYKDKSGYDYYFTIARRPYNQVELTTARIVAGINRNDAKNSANMAFWCLPSSATAKYTSSGDAVSANTWTLEDHNSFWDLGADYPDGNPNRYTRYFSSDSNRMFSSIPDGSGGSVTENTMTLLGTFEPSLGFATDVIEANKSTVSFGGMFGNLIKTDVNTGLLVYYSNGIVLRKGETLQSAISNNYENVGYEFKLNGEPWTLYLNDLLLSGEETNPSPTVFCVRGQ